MLTQEQINEIRAKSGLTPLQNTQPTAKNTVGRFDYLLQDKKTEDKGGFISDVKQTIGKTATKIKETFKRQEESLMKGDITGQNPLETGVQTVGSLIEGGYGLIFDALKALTPEPAKEAIKGKAEQIVQNKTLQDVVSSVNDWAEKNPRAAADLSGLLNIASLIPAGKGAETAVDVAQQAGKVALKAGEDTGKAALRGTGAFLEKTGEVSVKSAIPLSKAEAGIVQTYKANNPLLQRVFQPLAEQPRTAAITTIEKGFAGTEKMIGVQAKREAKNLWKNKIEPALKGAPETYNIKTGLSNVEKQISKIADPSRRKSLSEALDALKEDYRSYSSVSYLRAQKIKSDLDKFIPEKAYQGKPIAGTFKTVQKMFADDIRENTYKVLKDANIKTDYLDYGNLKNLQEWGQKAMTGAKSKAGFGSFVSNLYEQATIPIKTLGGQALVRSGRALKRIGKKL